MRTDPARYMGGRDGAALGWLVKGIIALSLAISLFSRGLYRSRQGTAAWQRWCWTGGSAGTCPTDLRLQVGGLGDKKIMSPSFVGLWRASPKWELELACSA